MSSARKQQREEWQAYLESLPYFENIAIYLEEKKDIQNELERRLSSKIPTEGKSGIAIILLSVKMRPTTEADAGPVVNFVHCAHVVENPVINMNEDRGTLKPREEVTEQIIAATHAFFKPMSGSPFMLSNFQILIEDGTKLPCEDSFFECPASLGYALDQLAAVVPTNVGGRITLACATPGAAIFYTLDGGRPSPRKTLYTAPFTPGPGVTINARAWLTGFLPSNIATIKT